MFAVESRDELRDRVIGMARADERVVAAAEVGSLSLGGGDRWSDLDLTFGVVDGTAVAAVLDDWTPALVDAGAVVLFDLPSGPSTYRVYLFPECLQADLSFTPASEFRPTSPGFRLLFGEAGEMQAAEPPSASELLGWATLWARHGRVSLERGRLRQAEHAIASMRERALDYACRRRGLPAGYGRGLEELPSDVYDRFALPFVVGAEPRALERALRRCVAALLAECSADADAGQAICDRLADTVAGL